MKKKRELWPFLDFAEHCKDTLTPQGHVQRGFSQTFLRYKKMSFFDEKWLLWGSRWLSGPGLEPGRHKGAFVNQSCSYLGGHFSTFSVFSQTDFWLNFHALSFSALGAI